MLGVWKLPFDQGFEEGEDEGGDEGGALKLVPLADESIGGVEEGEDPHPHLLSETFGDEGEEEGEEVVVEHEPDEGRRGARLEHAKDLFEKASGGAFDDLGVASAQGAGGLFIDREAEPGLKLEESEHSDGVLSEAEDRVADDAEEAGVEVVEAVAVVDHLPAVCFVVEAVDGEVAPGGVGLSGSPLIVAEDEGVVLGVAGSKGGDLDHLLAEVDMGEAKSPADQKAAAKEALDLFGPG